MIKIQVRFGLAGHSHVARTKIFSAVIHAAPWIFQQSSVIYNAVGTRSYHSCVTPVRAMSEQAIPRSVEQWIIVKFLVRE